MEGLLPHQDARAADKVRLWRPCFKPFLVAYVCYLAVGWWWAQRNVHIGIIDWYTSVVWLLPLLTSVLGLLGGVRLARRTRDAAAAPPDVQPIVSDGLIVVVPTIGRPDTQLALERVVGSCRRSLRTHFPSLRIDVAIKAQYQ